jgi:hypothetical protein
VTHSDFPWQQPLLKIVPELLKKRLTDEEILHSPRVAFTNKKQSMEACLLATDFYLASSYIHLPSFLVGLASGKSECTGVADSVVTGAESAKHCFVGTCPEGCRSSHP